MCACAARERQRVISCLLNAHTVNSNYTLHINQCSFVKASLNPFSKPYMENDSKVSPLLKMSFIFGKNTKHSVAVVDVRIIDVMIMKASVTCSESRFAKTTTLTLVMTAPYTENPIYFESFSADIFTCLVSHAI